MSKVYSERGDTQSAFVAQLFAPVIDDLTPSSVSVLNDHTIQIAGANFVNGLSVVRINGVDLATSFLSTTTLEVAVEDSDIPTDDTYDIQVINPGVGVSNIATLTVYGDPDWADTILMMDATNQANGGSILDYSPSGRTLTAVGNAAISNQRFEFDGTGDWITAPDSTDWDFASGGTNDDFTLEAFGVEWDTTSEVNPVFTHYDAFSPAANNRGWTLTQNLATNIQFSASTDGQSGTLFSGFGTPAPLTVGVTYDLAVVRSGSDYYWFVDGVLVATGTNAGIFFNSNSPLAIGGRSTQASSAGNRDSADGRIAAIRITTGVAKWTSNYTPEVLPLPKGPT